MSDRDHEQALPAEEVEAQPDETAPEALDTTVEGGDVATDVEGGAEVEVVATEAPQEAPADGSKTDESAPEQADEQLQMVQGETHTEEQADETVAANADNSAVDAEPAPEGDATLLPDSEVAPSTESTQEIEATEGETTEVEATEAEATEAEAVDGVAAAEDATADAEEADADAEVAHEVAAPQQPKVYPRIVRPKKSTTKPVDPAVAVIAGSWTTTALSHDFRKTEVRTNGIDAAVKMGRVNIQGGEDCIQVKEMTGDTQGMQTLYTRMLTTKQWW
jgi:hypothetical protein